MLELRHVVKKYSGIPVVNDVSFTIRPGEVTGYLGPNGSGKSTTLKMITRLIEPSAGEILFDGVPINRDPIAHRQRLGYVPEDPQLYSHLTGYEYLEMVGHLRGLPEAELKNKNRRSSATPLIALRSPRSDFFLLKGHAAEDSSSSRGWSGRRESVQHRRCTYSAGDSVRHPTYRLGHLCRSYRSLGGNMHNCVSDSSAPRDANQPSQPSAKRRVNLIQ